MPSTIPYDPSLVLTNVVTEAALDNVTHISEAQAPVDAAQDHLNALLATRRSLDMTKTELSNLAIATADVDTAVTALNTEIVTVARDYVTTKISAERTIQGFRAQIRSVHQDVESPVDYVKTQIKTMPLAADSMNMDVQYFSLDENDQTAITFSSQISAFVSNSASFLGDSISNSLAGSASRQASQQAKDHKIVGTLVLCLMHSQKCVDSGTLCSQRGQGR